MDAPYPCIIFFLSFIFFNNLSKLNFILFIFLKKFTYVDFLFMPYFISSNFNFLILLLFTLYFDPLCTIIYCELPPFIELNS